jgi:hypothetical protein
MIIYRALLLKLEVINHVTLLIIVIKYRLNYPLAFANRINGA